MSSENEQLSDEYIARLGQEVLEDALRLIFGDESREYQRGRPKSVEPAMCREAWQWVSLDDKHSMSFIHCAELSELDPFELRIEVHNRWRLLSKEGSAKWDKLFVPPISEEDQIDRLIKLDKTPILVEQPVNEMPVQFSLAI